MLNKEEKEKLLFKTGPVVAVPKLMAALEELEDQVIELKAELASVQTRLYRLDLPNQEDGYDE